MPETCETKGAGETIALGERLAAELKPGDCVALVGELGSGKTVLVRGIARGLGLKDHRLVSSPTFVLVQEYPGRLPLYHVDLYRLRRPEVELADLGLEEMLANGVVVIEWADRAGDALPRPRWQITIQHTGAKSRRFRITRID